MNLTIGALSKELVESIDQKNDNRKKLYLYSGHDTNIHFLSNVLDFDLPAPGYPEFGSAIIIEKYRNKRNKSFVKVNKIYLFFII